MGPLVPELAGPRGGSKGLDTSQATPYTFGCWTRGDLRQLAPRKKLLKSRTSTQTKSFEPSPSLAWRVLHFREPLLRRQSCGSLPVKNLESIRSLRHLNLCGPNAGGQMAEHYQLKCRECGKLWGNQPRSFCDECLSPLEVVYDLDAIRPIFTRKNIEAGPHKSLAL